MGKFSLKNTLNLLKIFTINDCKLKGKYPPNNSLESLELLRLITSNFLFKILDISYIINVLPIPVSPINNKFSLKY